MPRFSRLFYSGLQRLFPSAGVEAPYPHEVSDTVSWVKDLTALGFHNQVRMRRSIMSAVGDGATLTFAHTEPDAGFFQMPTSFTVWNGSAVNGAAYSVSMDLTGSAQDPWGAWDTVDRGLWEGRVPASLSASVAAVEVVPVILPMTRGYQLVARVIGSVVGVTYRTHYHWLDVPGDIVTLERMVRATNSSHATSSLATV